MKLSVKASATACALTFGLVMFAGGIMALLWPDWGARFIGFAGSLFPGVEEVAFGSVIVATLYALVDGAILGACFAWIYNKAAGGGPSPTG